MSSARQILRPARNWIFGALLLVPVLAIKPVQDRVDFHTQTDGPDPDILYFGSPSAVRKLALGYEGLFADFYWMRTIQYYGRRDEADRRAVRYKNLGTLIDMVTTLDPDLMDAYSSGATFLAEADPIGAGQPGEALKLLDKGIAGHPQNWRLFYDKGFVYFSYLKDFEQAGRVWLSAVRMPDAPPWMEALAAMALTRGGAIDSAKAIWQRQYHESPRADLRENARNHLVSLQVAEDLWTLEFFIERFHSVHKAFPGRLAELVSAGLIRRVPVDPTGIPYRYVPSIGEIGLSPESSIRFLKVDSAYREALRARLEAAINPARPTSEGWDRADAGQ